MHRVSKIFAGAIVPTLLAAGCSDFLSGDKLEKNPTLPSTATVDQLLVGVATAQAVEQEGALARIATMWAQQFAGTDRQYIAIDQYDVTEDDITGEFNAAYAGGGLIDLREIQAATTGPYRGIARVWEALIIGTHASVWGDIPYSEAVSDVTDPALDDQAEVYARVQAVLDSAIADLQATGDAPTPSADLIYAGNTTKWLQAAHTLKARYYLHWTDPQVPAALATTACGGNCAQKALAATANGISASANNFTFTHDAQAGQENVWYQFMFVQRDSYIRAGKFLVDLLTARNDPRLTQWFEPGDTNIVIGAEPAEPQKAYHAVLNQSSRGSRTFDQPIITAAENTLLRAEAQYRTGDEAGALLTLNAYRTSIGMGNIVAAGPALLKAILEELYLAYFQNIEAWTVYRRSCYPNLTPSSGASEVGARLLYGVDERNANSNVPLPSEQPTRNDFDPPTTNAPDGSACIGQ
ncbi:MAG TPA: SusD/RagB family nutrient-binding outer membrane lipoprotein [Gemmatimonadaceae bacterium]|nr:SusD/RagB family nutrient-binding outer membrane lipoprotein [Gemmatimonadaceae bacterium]